MWQLGWLTVRRRNLFIVRPFELLSANFYHFALFYLNTPCWEILFNFRTVASGMIITVWHVSISSISLPRCFSNSFIFGGITIAAGVVGLTLGGYLSQNLRLVYQKADPIICGIGLVVSAPLLLGCTYAATSNTILCYVLLFLGQVALNLNWAIVGDILLVRKFKGNGTNFPVNTCRRCCGVDLHAVGGSDACWSFALAAFSGGGFPGFGALKI